MDINAIQGMNVYTANALKSDTTLARKNEISDLELNKESAKTVPEAFQVNITQEAIALQTGKTEDFASEDQKQQTPQEPLRNQQYAGLQQFQSQRGSLIDTTG
ncbi:hypothetical protein [uncultured Desulfobacter sp.]|uniref:hypothetical protein n=1 Tax=uncultured Desulfobacter sp. TaxID=240139 RepID=UPI002AAA9C23|nr:hypothetical protein [uncultured Desulfobacter sp.]